MASPDPAGWGEAIPMATCPMTFLAAAGPGPGPRRSADPHVPVSVVRAIPDMWWTPDGTSCGGKEQRAANSACVLRGSLRGNLSSSGDTEARSTKQGQSRIAPT